MIRFRIYKKHQCSLEHWCLKVLGIDLLEKCRKESELWEVFNPQRFKICYTIYMRLPQFLLLALVTLGFVFLMNDFLLSGHVILALVCGFFALQLLNVSYRISRFIAQLDRMTK